VRDDRHGRATRADNDRRRRPSDGFRVRDAARFERLTREALATLPEQLLEHLDDALVQVEDLPPIPSSGGLPDDIPLARFERDVAGTPARVVVYRRPLEARALDRADLAELVRSAVGHEVAGALGIDIDLDDDWDDEQ
jgi:predicted Zn-dependent protease with MMP-like domain